MLRLTYNKILLEGVTGEYSIDEVAELVTEDVPTDPLDDEEPEFEYPDCEEVVGQLCYKYAISVISTIFDKEISGLLETYHYDLDFRCEGLHIVGPFRLEGIARNKEHNEYIYLFTSSSTSVEINPKETTNAT